MLIELNSNTISQIKNPAFAAYAGIYEQIYERFMAQVAGSGIQVEPGAPSQGREAQLERLRKKGARFRNCGKSIVVNQISPACEACRTGVGSTTYFISLKCHRNCFYCFNPNQEDYEEFLENQRDVGAELTKVARQGLKVKHIALTGGEPLLFKDEAVAFFETAQTVFPKAYTRLYTCGDTVDERILNRLQAAGLDEIRFSIRMHDLEKGHREVFDHIAMATQAIPQVMVEMPVLPDSQETMVEVLLELEKLGIFSINLLEFCYPFRNAEEFNRRGFHVKARPYQVLYNYWYAGGLPISGSEEVCLQLLEFALDQELKLGVHYCSLENKHTGQVYQQNRGQSLPRYARVSNKDYFIKTAKVFGDDIPAALRTFKRINYHHYTLNQDYGYLEFHVNKIKALTKENLEVGIAYYVSENRNGEQMLRELKVDYTTPRSFNLYKDI
jgi:pyruvate formate-lyase activating enzyme-like uncharacterized protein